ncbi:MAG TPA: hypothetical protein VM282_22615 [Acidimicrobiales bacterium]|nr:hypothetical protein [Acidimicrobiales bacterium]
MNTDRAYPVHNRDHCVIEKLHRDRSSTPIDGPVDARGIYVPMTAAATTTPPTSPSSPARRRAVCWRPG